MGLYSRALLHRNWRFGEDGQGLFTWLVFAKIPMEQARSRFDEDNILLPYANIAISAFLHEVDTITLRLSKIQTESMKSR